MKTKRERERHTGSTQQHRAVHQWRASHFSLPSCQLPDYFHIKHRSLQAEVKPRTTVFIWVAWQCLSTHHASKRAGENRRIPLILSNWVAAFAAARRMWESRDKKTSIYSPRLPPPDYSAPPTSPFFSRAGYCVSSVLPSPPPPNPLAWVEFCFPSKFHGISVINNNNIKVLRFLNVNWKTVYLF